MNQSGRRLVPRASITVRGKSEPVSRSGEISPGVAVELLKILRCPHDFSVLDPHGEDRLNCQKNHAFPVIEGIPVLLRSDQPETLWVAGASWKSANNWMEGLDRSDPRFVSTLGVSDKLRASISLALKRKSECAVDPVISHLVLATSGYLYEKLIGKLDSTPIPHLRMERGDGKTLLDVGSNWGRWTMAAAMSGYRVVGLDPSIGALLTAKRLAEKLGLRCWFVCADGRFLPFVDQSFSRVFSYSVLQHFAETDTILCLRDVGRVLEKGGISLVQMPNHYGVRGFYHRWRRGFRPAAGFEVRYWKPKDLVRVFRQTIGASKLSVDGFLGLGIQASDYRIVPLKSKIVILTSEILRHLAKIFPPLKFAADSLYVSSVSMIERHRQTSE